MAKKSMIAKAQREPKFSFASRQPVPDLRSTPRVYAAVSNVPCLL